MKALQIFFEAVEKAVLREIELDERPGPTEVLVKSLYSGVSSGTEGASYQGYGGPYPPTAAGGSVAGEIIAAGNEVKDFAVGDIVNCFCNHDSYVKCDTIPKEYGYNGFCIGVKIPTEVPKPWAALVYHYSISLSAVRQSRMSVGDDVLVIGGGLIGNTAAQNFAAAGALVVLADLSERRLEVARACGIPRAFNPAGRNLVDMVKRETDGRMLHHCILAIEGSAVIQDVIDCMRVYGNITLLGGYRKEIQMDVAAIFRGIQGGSVRIQGAGGCSYAIPEKPYLPYSILGNYRQILHLMKTGKLCPAPLISLVSPQDCQQVYQDIVRDKDKYLGVVFDWTRL